MKIQFRKKWLLYSIGLIGFFFLGVLIFIIMVYSGVWGKLPSTDDLKELKQAQATLVYDAEEKLIGKYFVFDRMPIAYEELPQHLIDALIATEDVRFYDHSGVDYFSLGRVLVKSILLQNESSGGGSTVSIQLAKNLFGRKNYGVLSMPVNKVKEAIIARRMERIYSKEEIITLYFNTVPFSDNTYGIESASRNFFNTTTKKLTLAQSATLIGSLKASHTFNPRLFPERSTIRRNVVLQQMVKYDLLSDSLAKLTSNEVLEIDYQRFDHDHGLSPYFREQVRTQALLLIEDLQKPNGDKYDLYMDGLRIHTTLDATMQEYAEIAMHKHMMSLQRVFEGSYGKYAPWIRNESLIRSKIKDLPLYKRLKKNGLHEKQILDSLEYKSDRKLFRWEGDTLLNASVIDSLKHYMKFLNTGFVALDPQSGAVKAYIGGIDYESFKYDHVVQSKRQVGSTFKPFVYTAAIESGMLPCTYFSPEQVTYSAYDGWTPTNSTVDSLDSIYDYSLKYALSRSLNTIAVKVLMETGIDTVITQARKMGIKSPLPQVPSLALGTAEMTLLELTTAYTSYVNRGIPATPYFIERITDKFGNELWSYPKPTNQSEAFSDETRQVMIEMLKATVNEGTASRLRSRYGIMNEIAGKTGTTQDNKDGWFVAITPKLVMASWTGNDDHRIGFRNTAIGQGANSALPMIGLFLQQLNKNVVYNSVTRARFILPSEDVALSLQCEDMQPKSFLEQLFGIDNPEKPKKKRKGFFSIFSSDD